MSVRRLPDRPDLDQLHRQAKELLQEMRASDASAKLADAQFALARSFGASSWTRLVHVVQLVNAIRQRDLDQIRALVSADPTLPGDDVFPPLVRWSLAGPAYTLSEIETEILLALGRRVSGPEGVDRNAVEHLLGTDSRNPAAKHRILEMWIEHGFAPPDTPVMALHRGRIDLLEVHLARDPGLLTRTFDIAEVYPLAPACSRQPYTAQGTPVHRTTLLHLAAYFDELEIAGWLLDRGMDPDAPAAIEPDGIGGYTALYSTVVSQHNFWVNYGKGRPDDARFTRLLLDRGASVTIRASLRAGLEQGHGGGPLREYRDVTPYEWGQQYHGRIFVSRESMRLIGAP
jgi:hypothetical protein